MDGVLHRGAVYLGHQRRNTLVEIVGCADDEFECENTTCVSRQQLCDGNDDCEGGEDELNCGKIAS